MNKTVIIAGAGHGGLVCAYNLAANGYDVTVYEASARENLGHDWLDTMSRRAFEKAGLPQPDDSVFGEYETAVFNSPFGGMQVGKRGRVRDSLGYADRKWLINYLIDCCIRVGVKFEFSQRVTKAITDGKTVRGIVLADGREIYAPLTVDACGMYSPVRKSLPAECGIVNEIKDSETFFVYRAYYNYCGNVPEDLAKYNIWFFNCGRTGLDWLILEDGAADLLIGGFGGLKAAEITEAVHSFRDKFSFIGDEIVRGGQVKTIPVRKTLSKFITAGYAAVGDSASMVEPLSGSGINLSMYAGKILADTVIASHTDIYTEAVLWPFVYSYFKNHGNAQIQPDVLKAFLTGVGAEDIEYLFTSRFLTDKELGGTGEKMTAKDAFDKVKSVVCRPSIIPVLAKAGIGLASIGKVCSLLPENYNEEAFSRWQTEYGKL